MRVWRIASATTPAFDGEGARRYGGRWTPKGLPATYTSATLSLAALERLVHTDPDVETPELVAIAVDIGADVTIHAIDVIHLPSSWRAYPPPEALTIIGATQLSEVAVLSVPSVVIPHERNYVLNPTHRDFVKLTLGKPEPFSFDPRLWKTSRVRTTG